MAEKSKDILDRARKRFTQCVTWEQDSRQRFKDDMRFLYGDSDNQEQWDAQVRAQRVLDSKPMVTINKTHTHWLHVVNHMLENKPAIKISPTGGQATYDSAQIYASVVRHIEYKSKADLAYKMATRYQVGGGVGYWRIKTEYADDNGFEQEIRIKPIPDPLCVYLDPYIKMPDGSDARFGFIFDDMPRDKAEAKYGDVVSKQTRFSDGLDGWNRKDSVRVAEYFEVELGKEWLYAVDQPDGGTDLVKESDVPAEARTLLKQAYDQGSAQRRRIDKRTVKWYLIVGEEIVQRNTWLGAYIPIVRVIGEEIVMDGKLDRKGLVRYLKDPQRAYNYNASAALEFGALQSKIPYVAPVEAIEGLENYWATANTQNHSYLPYNHADENGNPVPPPQRAQAPSSAPVYMEGMQTAEHELMMASGQYEATFSEQGNEVSGVSIEQRQKQGERVTYHFQDAFGDAIAFTGVQLIDLIPKIYDTKRIVRIVAEDGEEQTIQVDPQAKQAVQSTDNEGENEISAIFNPNVGKYEVVAEVGKGYTTRRKEAFDAMTQLLVNRPELAQVMGDLYMGTADFPVAAKLQERMRNWIKGTQPFVLGEGPTPQEQQLQQQLQQTQQFAQQLAQELQDKSEKYQLEQKRVDIDALNHLALRMENDNRQALDAFKAETDRLKALMPAMAPESFEMIIRKAIAEMLTAPNPSAGIQPDAEDPANAYAAGMSNVLAPVQSEQQPQQ